MSTYLLNLLSCPYPSTPPRIITTLLFQAYTYSWVMLLIVLYDGAVLGWMTWYTYCMSGAMKMHNGASDGNHRNDNNTTTSSSSLLDGAAAVAVVSPWVRRVYST